MKEIVNLDNGAITISEQGGDFWLNLNGSLGGGAAAGWVSGQASIKLATGSVGLKAAEAFINAHVSGYEAVIAAAIEPFINAAVAKA